MSDKSRLSDILATGAWPLLLLPLLLLLVESSWAYNSLSRDPWIYHGYFENGTVYLAQDHFYYFASRLSVHVPGFVIHHLLPPLAANLALRLLLYWTIVGSFYLVARAQAGAPAALLLAITFGSYPWFLTQVGSDYVAAFGLAYFMLAMAATTRAADVPRLRGALSVAAGAAAAAMVAANIAYVLLLPPLLLQHLAMSRRSPRPGGRFRDALWASAGAAGAWLFFGGVSWAFGGRFLFLKASIDFAAGFLPQTNPFRDPTYSWIGQGFWLILPAVAVAGSAVMLSRARSRPLEAGSLTGQLQLLVVAVPMTIAHVFFGRSFLQYSYYAILMAPVAFLALASQLATLLPPGRRTSIGPIAAALGAGLLPLVIPGLRASLPSWPAPLALPLLIASASVVLLAWGARGRRLATVWVLALGLGVSVPGYARPRYGPYGDDGAGMYRQITTAIATIESFDRSYRFRLWYDMDEINGKVFDAIASAFQHCFRMVSLDFPDLHGGMMCGPTPFVAGIPVVVMSSDPAAGAVAREAFREIGIDAEVAEARTIPGPARGLTLTLLHTRPLATP